MVHGHLGRSADREALRPHHRVLESGRAVAAPSLRATAVSMRLGVLLPAVLFCPSYLAGLAWVPAVLLCAGRLLVRPGVCAGVRLGVALAFQFLTGHAQIVCYEVYAIPLGAVAYLLCRREWQPGYLGRIVG